MVQNNRNIKKGVVMLLRKEKNKCKEKGRFHEEITCIKRLSTM